VFFVYSSFFLIPEKIKKKEKSSKFKKKFDFKGKRKIIFKKE